jgi:hypothetical protein
MWRWCSESKSDVCQTRPTFRGASEKDTRIQYDTNKECYHSIAYQLIRLGFGDLKRHELPGWSFLDNIFVDSFYERFRCFDPGCDDPLCTTHHSSSLELAGLAVGVQNPIGSPLNRRSVSVFQCIVTGFLL